LGIDDRWKVNQRKIYLENNKRELYLRVFVMILMVISILWIPIVRESQGARLFDYIAAVSSFLAPPVTA